MTELTPTQEIVKAKRGKNYRSAAPGGYGSVDEDGYRKVQINHRYRNEQVWVWEHFNGPIPRGMQVHHRDQNKLNNEIDNLELLSASEHATRHQRAKAGYELRADGWYKPCHGCSAVLPLDCFYKRAGALKDDHRRPLCKACHKKSTVERRRALRSFQ